MRKPYVGITGITQAWEVELLNIIVKNLDGSHQPMFGFVVSQRRLGNMVEGGKQSPPARNLPELVQAVAPNVLPMLHYYTEEQQTLPIQVEQLLSIGHMYEIELCRAVQLNMPWPDPKQIEWLKSTYPDLSLVLQLPNKVLTPGPSQVARRAAEYNGLINHILIDPSGGTGTDIDLARGIEMMLVLQDLTPIIGIAGGFSPDNVAERIRRIKQAYPHPFCIDAQGKLRNGLNFIDMDKAMQYIDNAFQNL